MKVGNRPQDKRKGFNLLNEKGNFKGVKRLVIKEMNNLKTIRFNHDVRNIGRQNVIQIVIDDHRFKNLYLVIFKGFKKKVNQANTTHVVSKNPTQASNSSCKTPCHVNIKLPPAPCRREPTNDVLLLRIKLLRHNFFPTQPLTYEYLLNNDTFQLTHVYVIVSRNTSKIPLG